MELRVRLNATAQVLNKQTGKTEILDRDTPLIVIAPRSDFGLAEAVDQKGTIYLISHETRARLEDSDATV